MLAFPTTFLYNDDITYVFCYSLYIKLLHFVIDLYIYIYRYFE